MTTRPQGLAGVLYAWTGFCLRQRLSLLVLLVGLGFWGLVVAPFEWGSGLPRNPVAVDAIPNLGENQQLIYVDWPGRSPREVEDQITYPLGSALLGVPGVKDLRSLSMQGFASIAVIFDDQVDVYWARSRLLEKLASLPPGSLPSGVQPQLGPDATALGQVLWYTLEARDLDGRPVPGWDLHQLRSLQDWTVKPALLTAAGVTEVASIGGYETEWLVEVDPLALQTLGISLDEVIGALAASNQDAGAGVTEINRVEYSIRLAGLVQTPEDMAASLVRLGPDLLPVRLGDLARIQRAAAPRRGLLDVAGAEAVGGVVTLSQGVNPRTAIADVHRRIAELALPAQVWVDERQVTPEQLADFARKHQLPALDESSQAQWQAWLRQHWQERPSWLSLSQVQLVPFYDRAELIDQTLATLNRALVQQLLVTLIVVLILLGQLRGALAVASTLPMAVLLTFIGMKWWGVEANIVALAGIAIAVGTIVDMGIILTTRVLARRREYPQESTAESIQISVAELGGAVLTAIATTVISFLPVFAMSGAEGKLFAPLAQTKTLVLLASALLVLSLLPLVLHLLLSIRIPRFSLGRFGVRKLPRLPTYLRTLPKWLLVLLATLLLAAVWSPLGPGRLLANTLLLLLLGGFVLLLVSLLRWSYSRLLNWCLAHKGWFLLAPGLLVTLGVCIWLGFSGATRPVLALAESLGADSRHWQHSALWRWGDRVFPGLGREFMPPLDEGSFLWMPSLMPHAGVSEALELLHYQNRAIAAIPEIEVVVGKAGRADTPLDPAPLSMIETIIHYKSEYLTDSAGRVEAFAFDRRRGEFVRDADGELIPDKRGRPYRQWRDHIKSPEDIWQEIVQAAERPGSTSAPRLQPIETRLLMLQTGMRAATGVKLQAPDLASLDAASCALEASLRQAPGVVPGTVNADRPLGQLWIEIRPDREAIARVGLSMEKLQMTIATALGGERLTQIIQGRERYGVRLRYPREWRESPEAMARLPVQTPSGASVLLGQLASIELVAGPQMIRSENSFLTAYVTFGGAPGLAEVELVEQLDRHLSAEQEQGRLQLPSGVSFSFAGSYQQQQRAAETLRLIIPLSLAAILLLLYWQFRHAGQALSVFSSVLLAWAGGFVLLWLWSRPGFLEFSLLGSSLRELFHLGSINLSIAVWVGFLALFGLAVDDGVVMGSLIKQRFAAEQPTSPAAIRQLAAAAAAERLLPCLMTSMTTLLALLPVLSATGRGADLMRPMAIPTLGGITFVALNLLLVPVLFCWMEERRLAKTA